MSDVIRRRRVRRGVVLAAIVGVLSSFALVGAPSAGAIAPIVWDTSVGTAAPPATLGPYNVTSFGLDGRPLFADVTNVVDPAGAIAFSPALNHRRIGSGWATWSHGYTGDVYATGGATSVTVTLPAGTGAFRFYAEPDPFAVINITATAQDGTTTGPIPVDGNGGAQYFGVYTTSSTLASVTITSTTDFAIGEFGLAFKANKGCAAGLTAHALMATTNIGPITGVYCVNYAGIGTYTQNGVVVAGRIIKAGSIIWFQAMGNNLRSSGYVNLANGATSFAQTKPTAATGKVTSFT